MRRWLAECRLLRRDAAVDQVATVERALRLKIWVRPRREAEARNDRDELSVIRGPRLLAKTSPVARLQFTQEVTMRSLRFGVGLILLVAPGLRAQASLPRFSFIGHHIGETKAAGEPWTECSDVATGESICTRTGDVFLGMSILTGYVYTDGRLSRVDARIESVAFPSVLSAFTKRYGRPRALGAGDGHDYAQWRFAEGRLHLARAGRMVVAQFKAER